ncbi:coiled-coil domain-containing protein 93 isoform X2 [Tanacetum coccineum]
MNTLKEEAANVDRLVLLLQTKKVAVLRIIVIYVLLCGNYYVFSSGVFGAEHLGAVLEKRESEVELKFREECARLELEVSELEEMLERGDFVAQQRVDSSLANAVERLNLAKTELAAKLREITSLKRQRDEVPTQAELIQYERRFSELNAHIQGKLRQTRKYYATYNALLEIKELMLKETSLLNSMSSQFHDALNTPAGRATVTSSMEGISKSIQQKLQNVQLTLQAEQKACEALKKKHAAANLEKRRCYTLLKAFQNPMGLRMNAREMKDFRIKVQRFQYRLYPCDADLYTIRSIFTEAHEFYSKNPNNDHEYWYIVEPLKYYV